MLIRSFHLQSNRQDNAEDNSHLQPLFYSSPLKTIKYADKPLLQGAAVEEIPVDTFAKSKNFIWTDAIVSQPDIRNTLWGDKIYVKKALHYIESRLHHPLTSLVVCKINEEVQHGVFLGLGESPLEPGALAEIYAGEIAGLTKRIDSQYSMSLCNAEQSASILKDTLRLPYVDAERYGNRARFFQDLPSEEELARVTNLSPLALSNIATENICIVPTVYYGCPISALVTNRLVHPGEHLGYSYGGDDWKNKKRCVFNKKGEPIGYFKNPRTIVLHLDYTPTKDMAVDRPDWKKTQPILEDLVTAPVVDEFNYSERFNKHIAWVLKVHLDYFCPNSPQNRSIASLQNRCTACDGNSDKVFLVLNNYLKSEEFKSLNESLIHLKKELILHMHHYNHCKKLALQVEHIKTNSLTPSPKK